MKKCVQCGTEISAGAKFCNVCGKNQKVEEGKETKSEPAVAKNVSIQASVSEQLRDNQTVQQITNESKNYFHWLNQQIKISKKEKVAHVPLFGFVNFILLIVLNSIALSVSFITSGYSNGQTPVTLFIAALVFVGMYFSLLYVVFYFILNRQSNRKLQLVEVFDSLFSPASLTVYVSLLSVIAAFILTDSDAYTAALLFLSSLIVSLSFVDRLFKVQAAFGRFFMTLFTMTLPSILLSIIFQTISGVKLF